MTIELKCQTCGAKPAPLPSEFSPFHGVGYECVEWSDNTHSPPTIKESDRWQRSNNIPEVGQLRIVRLNSPLLTDKSGHTNLVYSPALASLNGWDEHPNEIKDSAIVRVSVQNEFETTTKGTWFEVEIVSVIRFDSLPKLSTRADQPAILDQFAQFDSFNSAESDGWTILSANDQSNFGSWLVLYTDPERVRLIAACEWGLISKWFILDRLYLRVKKGRSGSNFL